MQRVSNAGRSAEATSSHLYARGAPQAVILAAGEGSRLRESADAPLKPLMRVAGSTLLEHAVRTCVEQYVDDIVVVVGYRSSELVAALAELRARYRIRVRPAFAADWQRGNGASTLASEPYVHGRFFLMMCDHIVDSRFLARLLAADDGARPCTLVVDSHVQRVRDLPEATKVRLAGRRIVAIGKGLGEFDAVDTGVFLLRPPIFDALRLASDRGENGLSAGVQILARRGAAESTECGPLEWLDVDTPADLVLAEQRLSGGTTSEIRKLRDAARARLLRPLGSDVTPPLPTVTEHAE